MANLGQICHRLEDAKPSDRADISKSIIKQMTNALFYIFRRRITHNDTHTDNFFYKAGGLIILGDFGKAHTHPKGYNPSRGAMKNNPFSEIIQIIQNAGEITTISQKVMLQKMKDLFSLNGQSQSEQRLTRDTFIKPWAASQQWSCISNEESDQKICALLQTPVQIHQLNNG
jgi:predicted unusual protein kinase regulating ubiquinone biosynthesis (AarF/ABC1/UbiB family)